MGSYDAYARVMGGILDAAEVNGFLGNEVKPSDKDRESDRWPPLVSAWHKEHVSRPVNVALIFDLITENADLHQVFADTLGEGKDLSRKQRLGHALKAQTDRVWGGFRIVRCSATDANKCPLYKLMPQDAPPN
jgi:hypothetical protein